MCQFVKLHTLLALFVEMVYINSGETKQATINSVGCYARKVSMG